MNVVHFDCPDNYIQNTNFVFPAKTQTLDQGNALTPATKFAQSNVMCSIICTGTKGQCSYFKSYNSVDEHELLLKSWPQKVATLNPVTNSRSV